MLKIIKLFIIIAVIAVFDINIISSEQINDKSAIKSTNGHLRNIDFNLDTIVEYHPHKITQGRGKHKKKKIAKFLYPIILGILAVKSILLPLFAKSLIVMSTSAFVMGKIALLATAILSLKLLVSNKGKNIEIIKLEQPYKEITPIDWDDSGIYSRQEKYIPTHNTDAYQKKPFL